MVDWRIYGIGRLAPHERRGHPRLNLALYRTRMRSRLLGGMLLQALDVSEMLIPLFLGCFNRQAFHTN